MVTIIMIYCNYVAYKHMATLTIRAIRETRDLGQILFPSNSWLTVLIFTVFFS